MKRSYRKSRVMEGFDFNLRTSIFKPSDEIRIDSLIENYGDIIISTVLNNFRISVSDRNLIVEVVSFDTTQISGGNRPSTMPSSILVKRSKREDF